MARIWNTPVFILATLYFVVDGIFSYVTRPIVAWLAASNFFERIRLWIVSLRPYPALALFAVPVLILEPAKPLAGYLLGTGHFFAGAVTFITAEVLKLTLVDRLFQLNRAKLLSIPAFAWACGKYCAVKSWLMSFEAWQRVLRWSRAARAAAQRFAVETRGQTERDAQRDWLLVGATGARQTDKRM